VAKYAYKAVDKSGKEVKGEIDAASDTEVIAHIRRIGCFPTQISEKKGRATSVAAPQGQGEERRFFSMSMSIPFLGIGTVRSKDIMVLTRQLSTMIASGLPLVRGLSVLHDQLRPGMLKDVMRSVLAQIEGGSNFSDALGKFPKVFSNMFVSTVKAGEAGGVLEVVLERMADFTEKNHKLKGKIKSALTYPLLVVFIAVSVLVFLIAFIIPKFMELFAEIGATLPLPTMILMSVSDFLRERWYICVAVLVAITVTYNILSRMKRMRFYIDRAKLHIPIFGVLMRKMSIANFSRTLSTLTASGVPILQALDITKDTLDNEVIIRALTMTYESIREGESMAAPLKASGVFSAMVVNMVEVGEETGSLEQMLSKVADVYEGEVDATVSALTSLLEPILIVTIGIIVGFIVVAMFLPLIKLLTALSI